MPVSHRPINDLNGDGRSDIVLRDDSGTINFSYGTADGGFTAGPSLSWAETTTIVGTGDFNGDGRYDLLFGGFSDASPTLLISALQTVGAGFQPDWEAATMVPGGWSVVGTGDFNGDQRTDILLRNIDGAITSWLIGPPDATIVDVPDAPFVPNPLFNRNPGANWHVAGTSDFNGDGRVDILWRADDGTTTNWLGQGNGNFADNWSVFHRNPGSNWHVAGTGDFNGDGIADILWRADDGTITNWLGEANGSFADNWNVFHRNPGTNWHVAGTGDYNGDGRADILWRAEDGTFTDWLGQANGSIADNWDVYHTNPGTNWHVAAVGQVSHVDAFASTHVSPRQNAPISATITGFDSGVDQIDLRLVAHYPGDDNLYWLGSSEFTGADRLEVRFANGLLQVDFDGDQLSDLTINVIGNVMASDISYYFDPWGY